jgi:hypothetical protein
MSKSGGNNRKRQRLDEVGSSSVVGEEWKLNDEELRCMFGGRKYIFEQDLTREVLLGYLLQSRAAEKVNRFDVKIVMLSSDVLEVKVDNTENKVWQVKKLLEEQHGFKAHLQELFSVPDAKSNASCTSSEQLLLADSSCINVPCKVMLSIRSVSDSGLQWQKWGTDLATEDGLTTLINRTMSFSDQMGMANVVVKEGECKYTEIKLRRRSQCVGVTFGVVRPECDVNKSFPASWKPLGYDADALPSGYGLVVANSILAVHDLGTLDPDRKPIPENERFGVLVDLSQCDEHHGGSVRFFRNGIEIGDNRAGNYKGYRDVRGPLVVALTVPAPERTAGAWALLPGAKVPTTI